MNYDDDYGIRDVALKRNIEDEKKEMKKTVYSALAYSSAAILGYIVFDNLVKYVPFGQNMLKKALNVAFSAKILFIVGFSAFSLKSKSENIKILKLQRDNLPSTEALRKFDLNND